MGLTRRRGGSFKASRRSFQFSVFSKRGGNGAHASTRGDAEGENRASGQTRDRLPQGSSEGGAGREILRINRERTHASGRWLGTKQQGGCAVGCISSPKGETSRGSANQHCQPQAARDNRT